VKDLVGATAANKSQIVRFESFLKDTRISRALIQSRAKAGLTQADVAEVMGCSQSAVSKLENSSDGELKVSEIACYMRATNDTIAICYGKPPTLAERIKGHVMGLKADLDGLADLAEKNEDSELRAKIDQFFGEASYNMLMVLLSSANRFPTCECAAEPQPEAPLSLVGFVDDLFCKPEEEAVPC